MRQKYPFSDINKKIEKEKKNLETILYNFLLLFPTDFGVGLDFLFGLMQFNTIIFPIYILFTFVIFSMLG